MEKKDKWIITLTIIQTLSAIIANFKGVSINLTSKNMQTIFNTFYGILNVVFPVFLAWFIFDIILRMKKIKSKNEEMRIFILSLLEYQYKFYTNMPDKNRIIIDEIKTEFKKKLNMNYENDMT